MFLLKWKNPSLDANKGQSIQVPVGAVVSNKASISFTGKGASNYGTIQQENLMRLLESFADSTPPQFPTVGQEWYDSANSTLKVCASTSPLIWKSLGGIQVTGVGDPAPTPAALGDIWFRRLGSASGFLYVYTGIGRYPLGVNTVGGWAQVWPAIEMAAGREEYDLVLSLVNQLINIPDGGNGLLNKVINDITPLPALDADVMAKFNALLPLDSNVLIPVTDDESNLSLDPNSTDWDTLLAAAKFAVDRLELPPNFVNDISSTPFVYDGRHPPASLTSLPNTDIRYPTLERRSNRRFGMVTLVRSFAETLNVLNTAVVARYTMKGVNGGAFGPSVTTTQHAHFEGSPGGGSAALMITATPIPPQSTSDGKTASLGIGFYWADAASKTAFLNGGGIIQIRLTHTLTSNTTAGDTNMKTLLDQRGVLRLTNDKVRTFSNVLPLQRYATTSPSLKDVNTTGAIISHQELVSGVAYTVTAAAGPAYINITIDATSTVGMNGTIAFNYEIIRDTTTYTSPAVTDCFPAPRPFQAADKYTGSSFLT
jgi:hypothetical protein